MLEMTCSVKTSCAPSLFWVNKLHQPETRWLGGHPPHKQPFGVRLCEVVIIHPNGRLLLGLCCTMSHPASIPYRGRWISPHQKLINLSPSKVDRSIYWVVSIETITLVKVGVAFFRGGTQGQVTLNWWFGLVVWIGGLDSGEKKKKGKRTRFPELQNMKQEIATLDLQESLDFLGISRKVSVNLNQEWFRGSAPFLLVGSAFL